MSNEKTGIKYHYDIIQGTDEWLKTRLAIVTASEVKYLFTAAGKIADNETSRGYMHKKALERITGRVEYSPKYADLVRGTIEEPIARRIYSDNYEQMDECGFVTNDSFGFIIGCSPDGLVGDDGGGEIKSRIQKFQTKTIMEDEVPKEYLFQIQTCMLVTGRKWWDFIQYSNGEPFYVKRVFPDLEFHEKIISAVGEFYKKVDAFVAEYNERVSGMIKTEYIKNEFDDVLTIEEGE